jgi:hypothetical protein
MNQQDKQQPMIEDLTVNQNQAEEVKGGEYKMRDVLISSYQTGGSDATVF